MLELSRTARVIFALLTLSLLLVLSQCGDSSNPTGAVATTAYPDHIAYVGAGGITIIKPDSTEKGIVVPGHMDSLLAPTWSPDKTAIAFLRRLTTGETRIEIFRNGQSLTVLATGMIEDTPWSPDGSRITFWRSDTVFVASSTGGPPVMLRAAAREPCFLNNATIVYRHLAGGVGSDQNGAVYRIPVGGGSPTKVSPFPDQQWLHRPRVSHSGDSIAFGLFQEDVWPIQRWIKVFVMDTAGHASDLGNVNLSPSSLDLLMELDFSYDNSRLIAVTEHPVLNDPHEVIIGVPTVNVITGAACNNDLRCIDYAPNSFDFVFAREAGGIAVYGRNPRVTRVLDTVGQQPDW